MSMTAFAMAEKIKDDLTVTIEVRSYNSRYLDIALRLPHKYRHLEDMIKGRVAERVSRGRLEIKVQVKSDADDIYTFELNKPKAMAFHETIVQLKNEFDINAHVSLDLLFGAGGVINPVEVDANMDASWPIIKDCLDEVLNNLVAMRKKEGRFLAQDFATRLDNIEKSVDQIEMASRDLLSHYQERLKERIKILTKDVVEIDPARIVQEAAFLAEKSDISEEIVRVGSHINQFRAIMNSGEPSGRKLNFLLQELNREFNTMGSKTENVRVSHMIVDVKSELEKIREQVQNVE